MFITEVTQLGRSPCGLLGGRGHKSAGTIRVKSGKDVGTSLIMRLPRRKCVCRVFRKHSIMGFTLVATVMALVTISAGWWVVHDVGVVAVSWQDVAGSGCIPLGAVGLFRLACAVVALFTLLCVYCDREDLELRYGDAKVFHGWTSIAAGVPCGRALTQS